MTPIKEHRIVKRIIELFSQGLSPRDMALSISIGSLIGVLPIFGISTALVTVLAIWMRLNLPIAVFIVYAVSPIHLILFIPFIRVGEWIFGIKHALLSFASIKEAFKADYLQALADLALQIGCGLTGWVIVGIPSAILIFYLLWQGLIMVIKYRS